MPPSRAQQRIVAYDALRVFAIVTVVAIHTLMPYRDLLPVTAPVRVFDDLLHYAVPLFVFISGALVWARPWPGGPGAYRSFLARRVALIGVPYLAWSALYLALRTATTGTSPAEIPGLLLSGHTWYHLYFVPMLLTFYALTPLAARLARRSPAALVLGAYAVRIALGPALAEAARTVLGDLGWSWATHVVTHLPHMALGAWFALTLDRHPGWVRRSWPVLLATGTAVLTAASLGLTAEMPDALRRFVYPAGMAATVLGMAYAGFALEPVLERASDAVLKASALAFGVYFVHPLFLLGVDALVATGPGTDVWLRPWMPVTTFVVVTAASFSASWLLARSRATSWLVGVRRSERGSG